MSLPARRIFKFARPLQLKTKTPQTSHYLRPFSSTSSAMARAYWFDNSSADQRAPHDSGKKVSEATLKALGIHLFHYPNLADVDALAAERSYKNRDEVTISPAAMGEVYESKVKGFFHEHLHEDEEIRYIRDGAGYFDVRSKEDEWVRIRLEKDDLMIMPPGSYHRFTTDENNYIKAMRLFKEDPKWTPLNRGEETELNPFRKAYVEMREKLMGESASA